MSKFFLLIYDWFEKHNRILHTSLIVSLVVFVAMATQISLKENITSFFGSENDKENAIFSNLKIKDKIIVIVSGQSPDTIINVAEQFEENLNPLFNKGLIKKVTSTVDDDAISKYSQFIYDYLPIFLNDSDFTSLEEKIKQESIDKSIANVYKQITSPQGMVIGEILLTDPLSIGTRQLQRFESLNPDVQYEIYGGHIFSKDLMTSIMFIEPSFGMGNTGENEELVSLLEEAKNAAASGSTEIQFVGGPIVAVANAQQIKSDTTITLSIALFIIIAVLFLSFRNRRSIPLIVAPPAFGAIFALAMVWLLQGEISAIAIGAGSVVLGISLSYSIHIVAHINHITSPRQIVEDLSTPLTIGSLTTIGAFAALCYTSSALLQDMGLFSVFALIGTSLFCLIYMPHYIKTSDIKEKSKVLQKIEQIVSYRYDNNKWLVCGIVTCTVVALYFFNDVRFNDDMTKICYEPENLSKAEARINEVLGNSEKEVYIVTHSDNLDQLTIENGKLDSIISHNVRNGKIKSTTSATEFLISETEQKQRIERWNSFWKTHKDKTLQQIEYSAEKHKFRKEAFASFKDILNKDYKPCSYTESEIREITAIAEWINETNGQYSLISRISLDEKDKSAVYKELEELDNTIIVDRAYYTSRMVESSKDDFNYILFISSAIVFIALLISYGRIELALLAFLPMCISWIIILGMMAVCNIEFNIVNIILATFIFGIGDDFSIFIIDGLLQEYKNGRQTLNAHKTAIFFSVLTAVVGMGVLILAKHPALQSIALISVLGMSVVVLVSYTVQPIIFRLIISRQTQQGDQPHTLISILRTVYCYTLFLFGCIALGIVAVCFTIVPIKKQSKKDLFHRLIYISTKHFVRLIPSVKIVRENKNDETFNKPAVIIANHQSFFDILLILSTTPKIVMITNNWVWHSPFIGWLVRYADFHNTSEGYDVLAAKLQELINKGYSAAIFPEGTRSVDGSIQRFHKGAFYLANYLKKDILPIIIYNTHKIVSKRNPLYIKKGIIGISIQQRIQYGNTIMGESYQLQAKNYKAWFTKQYNEICEKRDKSQNECFRDALIKNYTYKGPVLEWYMRIKCKIDGYYDIWDRMIPRNATITDIGCGYGQMSFMLGILSPMRKVFGIDYDNDKIELANHSFLCKENISFSCADMRTVDIPTSDAILFNDSLHYISKKEQIDLLRRSIKSLNNSGIIIVRDGDNHATGQQRINHTEVWSTKILRFNKTTQQLDFANAEMMKQFAAENNLNIRIRRCDKDSSETLYILSKKENSQNNE